MVNDQFLCQPMSGRDSQQQKSIFDFELLRVSLYYNGFCIAHVPYPAMIQPTFKKRCCQ